MKKTMVITSLIMLILAVSYQPLKAQGNLGIGFVVGEPTGIAWKYRMNDYNAIDGAIGFSPYDRYRFHVDYLWHSGPFEERELLLHYGIGAAVGFGRTEYIVTEGRRRYFFRNDDVGLGMRGVVGLTYKVRRSPIDLFVEAAPLLILSPGSGFGVDAGLGIRFYP